MKGKHQEAKRKCRKKELEDLDFEKTVKDCPGKYEKNQESLVFQKPREESRRSPQCRVLVVIKHYLLEAEK